jgi:DNA replication initiation complex subunit (GINS family)
LKIVIADASDQALDSGVLIEGSSIISYDRKFTIPFDEDAYNLTKETRQILDKLINVVEENPEYILEVSGHTDSDGDEDYNIKLSKERSEGVVDYILSKGVSDDRFIVLNKGESMPIATNNTEEGRQANRRVEVKVIPSYEVQEDELVKDQFNYVLKQNFPNPTKGKTTVQAVIKQGDVAVVTLYSLTGAMIQQVDLYDGQVEFDTSELESGIYVYSLIVNGKTEKTKRLVVAK